MDSPSKYQHNGLASHDQLISLSLSLFPGQQHPSRLQHVLYAFGPHSYRHRTRLISYQTQKSTYLSMSPTAMPSRYDSRQNQETAILNARAPLAAVNTAHLSSNLTCNRLSAFRHFPLSPLVEVTIFCKSTHGLISRFRNPRAFLQPRVPFGQQRPSSIELRPVLAQSSVRFSLFFFFFHISACAGFLFLGLELRIKGTFNLLVY